MAGQLKSDIIEEMFEPIIPKTCMGEQYADDVALVFRPNEKTVAMKTKYQKVDIIQTPYWGQVLFIDNLLMKTDKDGHIINEMIVHPIMLTGSKKRKALVVGGGEGFTATLLLKYPYIEQVDIIDIDGEFVDICKKHYPEQMKCLDDSRVKLIVQDGLDYMRSTDEVYDAIFTTPTDPLSLSDPLFIDEYYKLCYKCLADDGIYETDAYMPFYKYGNIDYAVIQKNIAKYFPISRIYTATIPTFPGGLFSFGFGSKKYDPIVDQQHFDFDIVTRYYNHEIHKACFILPQFMIDRINEEKYSET
jgi:spermidine synthase